MRRPYQYLLGKVSTTPKKPLKNRDGKYQYLLGKVSTEIIVVGCDIDKSEWYQYLLGKVSTSLVMMGR